MKKLYLIALLMIVLLASYAQAPVVSFACLDENNVPQHLDSVRIENWTRNWMVTICYPNLSISLDDINIGIAELEFDEDGLARNIPNPFDGRTRAQLTLSENEHIIMRVFDITGKSVAYYEGQLEAGKHDFDIVLSTPQTYILQVVTSKKTYAIKMVNVGRGGEDEISLKTFDNEAVVKSTKQIMEYDFEVGDCMHYQGFVTIGNTMVMTEPVTQNQYNSETITFLLATQQADGQPCPGAATVTDIDSNTYNTVRIGYQCWMKENLRTTRYANGTTISLGSSTSTITSYRYYPNNDSSNVSIYGYLYNWPAVMHGASSSTANPSGVQGICPDGWHVPSDAEWTQLTNYVSNQIQYQCDNNSGNIAKVLASTTGWASNDNNTCAVGNNPSTNNSTGFSALPAGFCDYGSYYGFGISANIWSATEDNDSRAYSRYLGYNNANVLRGYGHKYDGFSVRCVRDATDSVSLPMVTTNTVSSITTTSAICGGNVTSDGGATVSARGVCWSTSQNPTISDSHTTDGSGTGNFISIITGLAEGTTYYVRAYAINSVGISYGNVVFFGVPNPNDGQHCPGDSTVTDIDNNTYNTVQIGNQCWMKENLRTTRYANGTSIPLSANTMTPMPHRYNPNNNSSNVPTYGYLYNWFAVMYGVSSSSTNSSGVQGICPDGWHVPSDAEWTQLTDYVGSQLQYQCHNSSDNIAKALASTTGWNSHTNTCAIGNNPSTNNATGFSALPAGIYVGIYDYFGDYSYFWSATELDDNAAYYRHLYYDIAHVYRYFNYKNYGLSVRCVRDATDSVSLPMVTTNTVSSITTTSAICGGNVTSDGGATVSARGVCWSTSQNPTVSDSHTTNGTGIGSFTSSITVLSPDTTYYVRAYATNSVGTAYGSQVSFTTPTSSTGQNDQPCPDAATVTDIDSNTYNTVQIGNQCWMKENLRTTRYANGDSISIGTESSEITPYRYSPNNDANNVPTYGYLYNWLAVMHGTSSSSANPSGVQGICPNGWHVPSDAEWTQLTDYVGSQVQYQCDNNSDYKAKALASTTGWTSSTTICAVGNDPSSNNATGFSVLPAGNYGLYLGFGDGALFWSASETNDHNAYSRTLSYGSSLVLRFDDGKYHGFSVRCVRDATSSVSLLTVTTNTVSSITTTSATCGGNVTTDGGATVTARGVCWSTSPNPTLADNHTTDGSGTGAFTSSITGLAEGTTYYVRAYATNSQGTSYGTQRSFTTTSSSTGQDGQPCPGAATVTDIDNNTYNTVQIGNQCWMKENLRTTRYANGDSISIGTESSEITPYRYSPNNDASNVPTYGYLYNWPAVMHSASSSTANPSGVQGICPDGWHVPSDAEWTQLTDYVRSQTQYRCDNSSENIAKALASTTGWNSSTNTCAVGNNPSSNNATGFSALPACFYDGGYYNIGNGAYVWSATENRDYYAYYRNLYYNDANVYRYGNDKFYGFSVRCVRD